MQGSRDRLTHEKGSWTMNETTKNVKSPLRASILPSCLLSFYHQGGGRWFDDGFVQHQAAEICFEGPTLRFAVGMLSGVHGG